MDMRGNPLVRGLCFSLCWTAVDDFWGKFSIKNVLKAPCCMVFCRQNDSPKRSFEPAFYALSRVNDVFV